MSLTEKTRVRRIVLDFPTADGFTLRYQEAVDIYRDGVRESEYRVSEPMPLVEVGETIPAALAEVFGAEAADIIAGSHLAAVEHEERLQEVADQRERAVKAEALAAEQATELSELKKMLAAAEQQLLALTQRAEAAEARVAAASQALNPAESATQALPQ